MVVHRSEDEQASFLGGSLTQMSPSTRYETAPRLARVAQVIWLISLTMVPIWVGVDLVASIPVQCIVAIIAVFVAQRSVHSRFTMFDAYFVMLLSLSFAVVLVGGSNWAWWAQIPVRWVIPYLAARVLVSAVGIRFTVDAIALVFGIVGMLAIVELLISWHPFAGLITSTPEYAIWSEIQIRGGRERSEWAFGHSIALGGSLSMSIPFILNSSYRTGTKLGLVTLVGAGIVATGSRGAVVAGCATAAICVIYRLKSRTARTFASILVLITGLLTAPIITPVLESFGLSTLEEQESLTYRNILYSTYLTEMNPFGQSPIIWAIKSNDSAFLQIGLQMGWVFLSMMLIPILLIVIRVLTGNASIAEISVVGQLPLFFTVALITQFELFVFFVVGIAVQMALARGPTHGCSAKGRPPQHTHPFSGKGSPVRHGRTGRGAPAA